MGLLDQELEKLAVAVGARPEIVPEDVERLVGRSRAANVFRILDAVGDGKPAEALAVLGELLEEGEDPLAILGPLTYGLRQLAAVGRQVAQGHTLGRAMDEARVPNWPKKRQEIERQVRHLGRRRLDQLTDWLVEINLGLKGGSPLPPRLQLERLIVKLARPREG
jgi:DNA polymerase-3 subunit delta